MPPSVLPPPGYVSGALLTAVFDMSNRHHAEAPRQHRRRLPMLHNLSVLDADELEAEEVRLQ